MSGIVRKKCCCDTPSCCYDPDGGPATVTVTFADCAACWSCDPLNLRVSLNGGFSGTFTLTRTDRCRYVYDGPYTATQLLLYDFACGASALFCGTDRIRITFVIDATFNEGSLSAEIYNSHPTDCDPCTNGIINGFLFENPVFAFDPCGGTAEVPNSGICWPGGETDCNYVMPDSTYVVTVGGTATVTL